MSLGQPLVEPAALGLTEENYYVLRTRFDVQSFVFATEMLPVLWDLYPTGIVNLTLLDVGSRTGAGTALLQYLHHPASFSRIKLRTTALDIDPSYLDYARVHFPDVEYVVGDIFDPQFTQGFDIVLCSHTLEHVPDPHGFLARLRALAKAWVIVACPFAEKDLIPGHVNTFDHVFFEETGAHMLKVYRSLTWHQSLACFAVYSPLLPGSPTPGGTGEPGLGDA
jgi:SAM-dependent methyltransferase